MERVKINCFRWGFPYEQWTRKWIGKHFWRISRFIGTEEDAMQECIILFFKVLYKYKDILESGEHLMALYKTSIFNQWIVWSRKNNFVPIAAGLNVSHLSTAAPETEHNLGELILAVSTSSWELQYVISAIADAPSEFLQIMFAHASAQKTNSRIKRMCCIRSRRNIVRELRKLCAAN